MLPAFLCASTECFPAEEAEGHKVNILPRITQLVLNKNATRTTVSPNKVYVQMEYLIKDKIQSQKYTALDF